MFTNKICLATVLLSLHAAHSYILLTANLDDVHSLAKQLAFSPVANQLQDIIRRASSIFNQHQERQDLGNKPQLRADPKLDEDRPPTNEGQKYLKATEKSQPNPREATTKTDATSVNDVAVWSPDEKELMAELNAKMSDTSSENSGEANAIHAQRHRIMRRKDPDVAELGRNASLYLKSIKKVFENF